MQCNVPDKEYRGQLGHECYQMKALPLLVTVNAVVIEVRYLLFYELLRVAVESVSLYAIVYLLYRRENSARKLMMLLSYFILISVKVDEEEQVGYGQRDTVPQKGGRFNCN